jgi:hypothetical protein
MSASRPLFPKQLGTSLECFPRTVAAFRLLAKYPASVAEPQRIRRLGERGRGNARDARREVIAQRQHAAVAIDEPDEPLADLGSAGTEKDVLVFERRVE